MQKFKNAGEMVGALVDVIGIAAAQPDPRSSLRSIKKEFGKVAATAKASQPFDSLSEQLRAIAEVARDGKVDPRLQRAPAGMSEGDPSGGGFIVQTNFAQELAALSYEQASLAPMCDRRETANPLAAVKIPGIDETSRADGSRYGGVTSYWAAEADSVTGGLPRFKLLEFSAKKLIAVVNGTSELMNDAPMWESHVKRAVAAEMGFQVDKAILRGNGVGQPGGIVGASGTIAVAKETSQVSGTINAENVAAMWARLPAPSRQRAVWLVNEDAESQLERMVIVTGTAGSTAPSAADMYLPQGAAGNAFPLLKGRPILALEQAPVLGQVGDIVLADLGHYILVDGGMTPMMSADVRFLNDEIVWRFILRVDGRPGVSTPITPFNGGATKSPFVTLAAR